MRSVRIGAFALLVACATMAFEASQDYLAKLGDLYPLYYGARAWLETGNAYDLKAVAPTAHSGLTLLELGNAYPFPAVLLVLPLSFLPPDVAGVVWSGLVAFCLVVAVTVFRGSWWLLLYLPLIEAVRIQQYAAVVLVMQIAALWCLRGNRMWLLGLVESLILTKPNQGALFVVVLLLTGRNWKQFAVWSAAIWGGSVWLSPTWPAEWLSVVKQQGAAALSIDWPLILLLPLVLSRDWISLSLAVPVLAVPFRTVPYIAAGLPLGVAHARRSPWLAPVAILWLYVSALWDPVWGTALTLVLPVVLLAVWHRRTRARLSQPWLARLRGVWLR